MVILVVGFFTSMMFGFIRGQQTEKRLFIISECLFPASQRIQSALTAFNEQIRLYNDVVVMGEEEELLDSASIKAKECQEDLLDILHLKGLKRLETDQVQDVLNRVVLFSENAPEIYHQIGMSFDNEALQEKAVELGLQTEQIRSQLADITRLFSVKLKDKLAHIRAQSYIHRYMNLGVFVMVLAASLVLVRVIVARYINNPLKTTLKLLKEVAEGDLTRSIVITGNDEIASLAHHFNGMVDNFKEILGSAQEMVLQMTKSGQEILATSQSQKSGVAKQSEAVSETTAAANELFVSSEHIGQHIKVVSGMANHVLEGMEKIKAATDKTNHLLTSLNQKSKEISHIVELIDDVADQTNLLSVNASIEAARVGEYGRGFTVVADHISKLADSTATSTKDIASLIEQIQYEMSEAILAMDHSLASIEQEIELAEASASKSQEIAMNTNQQISGSKQIALSMESIDQTMKEILWGAEQSADTAGQLTELAENLKVSMSKFKIS